MGTATPVWPRRSMPVHLVSANVDGGMTSGRIRLDQRDAA
jgi:hypothetical protein